MKRVRQVLHRHRLAARAANVRCPDRGRARVPDSAPRVVVEVGRRGKLVVGEPYFAPGVPIVLDTKGSGDVRPGDLAVVRPGRGRARVERGLGSAARIENVLEALLVEQGARVEFEPYTVPEPSLDGRVDLRELTTFTVDPETAKDFDDALSFRREADGIRAWVHIADVSHFVPAGSPLDHGAARRAFSTYVPGLVAPMLPPELADDACSLRPYQDRLCVTVEIPPRRRAALLPLGDPLERAADLRRGASGARGRREILEQLALAGELATALRARRFARGALDVTRPRSSSASRTAASPTRGSSASRTRTCSSRS